MTTAHGTILPSGTATKIVLTGDTLNIEIVNVRPENGHDEAGKPVHSDIHGNVNYDAITKYPDGYERHHQVKDVVDLLGKISIQLKGRYNLESFEFGDIPKSLATGEILTVKGITYVA